MFGVDDYFEFLQENGILSRWVQSFFWIFSEHVLPKYFKFLPFDWEHFFLSQSDDLVVAYGIEAQKKLLQWCLAKLYLTLLRKSSSKLTQSP